MVPVVRGRAGRITGAGLGRVAEDPVAITHSSGTTRMPAAVVHSHQSLFAAVRAVRLTEPRQHGPVRELSAFPQAHTAGVIILNEALCNGYELLCLSEQGSAGAGKAQRSRAAAR